MGPCPVAPADRNILYENRLLGLPRYVTEESYFFIDLFFFNLLIQYYAPIFLQVKTNKG